MFRSRGPTPSKADWQAARALLKTRKRPAVLGRIGGDRPKAGSDETSWWSGNFLGAPNEEIPVCRTSGRTMQPLLQVRTDELPVRPPPFEDIALLTLWLDLAGDPPWEAANGEGFFVRSRPVLNGLQRLPAAPGNDDMLPSFPVFWSSAVCLKPDWDDVVEDLPPAVATADDACERLYGHPEDPDLTDLIASHPIRLGGWPGWIQDSTWPEGAQFVLQIDATDKGRFGIGDGGSLYLFRDGETWLARADCY